MAETMPITTIRNEPGILEVRVGYDLTDLHRALNGVDYLWVTAGHKEFGIECTIAIGDRDVTVTNQPDRISAIINARKALDAQETPDA